MLTVRRPGADRAELLVIGVPGDREVDLKRVEAALHPATVAVFEDWAAHPELVRGYIGPQILAKLRHPLPGRPAGGAPAPPG